MINALHCHVLIPGFETLWKRRRTGRYWRELERSQWLSRAELEARQLESLRRLLKHAAAECPYYRAVWRELRLEPATLSSLADFQAWPVIDRDIIRTYRQQMRSPAHADRLIHKATGGSSGVPLTFDLNHDSSDRRMAAWHRGYGWAGAAIGTKQWYLWGGPVGDVPWRKRWKDALYHRIYRRRVLNSFYMSEERLDFFLADLNRTRPDCIVAYTNPLHTFARLLDERGLRPYSPGSIIVGAEKLHEFQRELIERVFRAPVFETYGSREFMLIAAECDRHQGMHLTHEHLLVEILDNDGQPTRDGEEGNVVITDLTNYGMPFIRYTNGDRAVAGWGTCSCGRGLPLLTRVVGRRLDMLHTPDGRCVPGEYFPHLLKEFAAVRRFQVVQETPDAIELRVVVDDRWTADDERQLDRLVRDVVGIVVRFCIAVVDDIPLTRAGKLQVVINRCGVPAPPDEIAAN